MGRQGVETCEKRRDTKNDEERMSNTYKENIKLIKDVIEEIADVKIMLDQLIELYGCSDDVEEMIGYKIDRQLKRIERKEKKKWKLL